MKMSMKTIIFAVSTIATFAECKKNKPALAIIKPHTYISQYTGEGAYLLDNTIEKLLQEKDYKPTKRVIYLYPRINDEVYKAKLHKISPEDELIYKQNNITVKKIDCSVTSKENLKKLKPYFSWWDILTKRYSARGHKAFKLISHNFNTIDVYITKIFMCDATFFATDHKGRIAILIDEDGRIVSILDDVKNEKEIFEAFGIHAQ